MTKSIVYYTCNTHKPEIDEACRRQLLKANVPIVSVSLNKKLYFGEIAITVQGNKSPLMMHKQILKGLSYIPDGDVFLCESDVLYHPSHFDFMPSFDDAFYFNTNVWRVHFPDGLATWTDDLQQVSGVCAHRDLLLDFYQRRVEQIKRDGFNRHYEPGPKQSVMRNVPILNRKSEYPNIDFRHDANLTASKRSPSAFRNKRYAKGWKEAESVEGWGQTFGRLDEFLESIQ